jgi:hypothetical protein
VHSDIFGYTTDELRGVATQYATISKVTEFCLLPKSREATSSSSKEVPSDVTIDRAREGTKGGKRRRKQRPQGNDHGSL